MDKTKNKVIRGNIKFFVDLGGEKLPARLLIKIFILGGDGGLLEYESVRHSGYSEVIKI